LEDAGFAFSGPLSRFFGISIFHPSKPFSSLVVSTDLPF
jgi:hypothetical protein